MSFSQTAIIVNPNAGNGSTGAKLPDIMALAETRLGRFKTYITTGPGDAIGFAEDAVATGARLVVCVGGDGTLNEVINGLMAHGSSVRSDLRLGFIPNGTGCDFIKTVPIPADIGEAIHVIAANHMRSIDVGRLYYKDLQGRDRCRYFHNIASFGLGGEVDQRVNRTTKMFGPFLSFFWATLISILLYGKKRISLNVDDAFSGDFRVWNVAVANGQYHGGGMHVAPDALVDDGLFHVTIIGDLSLAKVFLNLPKLYNGQIKKVDTVITLSGKRIDALSDQRVLLDIDGEQLGMLPAAMEMVPDALNVITAAQSPSGSRHV